MMGVRIGVFSLSFTPGSDFFLFTPPKEKFPPKKLFSPLPEIAGVLSSVFELSGQRFLFESQRSLARIEPLSFN
jgi:hypothetical protein